MTPTQKQPLIYTLCRVVINGAALLVPDGSRTDWKNEWMAEISWKRETHLTSGRVHATTQVRLLYRSMGSFIDAFVLRCDYLLSPATTVYTTPVDRRPVFLGLAALAFLTICGYIISSWIISRYGSSSIEYFRFYFGLELVQSLALLGTLFLLYRSALGATRIWRGVRLVIMGLAFIVFLNPTVTHWDAPGPPWVWFPWYHFSVSWLCLVLTALLFLAVQQPGLAEDLLLPVSGMLIILVPTGAQGVLTFFVAHGHHFDPLPFWRWLDSISNCCTFLAFVLWGVAWRRKTRHNTR